MRFRRKRSWQCCDTEKNNINAPAQNPLDNDRRGRVEWRRILPGVLVSLVSLIVVFYFADLEKLRQALLLADLRLVFLAMGFMLVWLMVRGMFWRTLLQEKAAYPAVFWTLNEGYLINNLLPFRLGEVARAFLLSRKAPVGFWEVLTTIIIERIMDLTLAVGLLFCTLPFVVGAGNQLPIAASIAVIILLAFLGMYLLARNRAWALGIFNRVADRLPIVRRLLGRAVPAFFDGLSILTDGKRFLRAMFWVMLDWLIAIFQFYFLLLAFIPSTRLLWSSFSLAVTALGIAAPSSPGAVGVFEAAMVGSQALFGVDTSVALAAAITAHLLQYIVTGVLGIYALVRDGESLAGLYRRVRGLQSERQG